eukprot:scaffold217886_cov30-Tisochrysis_lutea.AAC.2
MPPALNAHATVRLQRAAVIALQYAKVALIILHGCLPNPLNCIRSPHGLWCAPPFQQRRLTKLAPPSRGGDGMRAPCACFGYLGGQLRPPRPHATPRPQG